MKIYTVKYNASVIGELQKIMFVDKVMLQQDKAEEFVIAAGVQYSVRRLFMVYRAC